MDFILKSQYEKAAGTERTAEMNDKTYAMEFKEHTSTFVLLYDSLASMRMFFHHIGTDGIELPGHCPSIKFT